MGHYERSGYRQSAAVEGVVRRIASLCAPHRIILYNQRVGPCGETSGFKLCVVAPAGDSGSLARDIYVEVDCEVPFDVVVYTPEQWERLIRTPGSFAERIRRTGLVLHG